MTTSTVLRAAALSGGACELRHLSKNTINACFERCETQLKALRGYVTQKRLFQLLDETTNSHFRIIYPCLALCFNADMREDTAKHSASCTPFRSIYLYFLTNACKHTILCHFQLVVTSATSSSSQDCVVCHNNAAEHCILLKLSLLNGFIKKRTSPLK